MKKLTIFLILLVLLLVSIVSAEVVYNVIDLGPSSDSRNWARSINNNNQIVGSVYYKIQGKTMATLFDLSGDGNNVDLGTLGGSSSWAYSINISGQIVGSADGAERHATLFDSRGDGNNIDLGTLGGNYSEAYSINDNSQIVGFARNSSGIRHATLFDSTGGGNNADLGTLGGNESVANSINNNGNIVGGARNNYYLRACLFDPSGDGNNIDLGTIGGKLSEAKCINNNGQIVGYAQDDFGYIGNNHACIFDSAGGGNNIDLGTLGGDESVAWCINDLGQIVGSAATSSDILNACLFDSTGSGANTDLNTLIDPSSGWWLGNALSINNDGWIVGNGWNDQYEEFHAFLLIPINTAPLAIAGPNQVAFICIGDTAEVTLDGSGSYDDDNDVLDYYWSWEVDGNLCEANGVSPTIQLPAGEYEIELVVDDGTDLSEPNSCVITVIEPLQAELTCKPPLLNTQSQRGAITAMFRMPEGITLEDIDVNEPLIFSPGNVEAISYSVFERTERSETRTWIKGSFSVDECIGHLSPETNIVEVNGKLNDGRCFRGSSSIFVFTPKPFASP